MQLLLDTQDIQVEFCLIVCSKGLCARKVCSKGLCSKGQCSKTVCSKGQCSLDGFSSSSNRDILTVSLPYEGCFLTSDCNFLKHFLVTFVFITQGDAVQCFICHWERNVHLLLRLIQKQLFSRSAFSSWKLSTGSPNLFVRGPHKLLHNGSRVGHLNVMWLFRDISHSTKSTKFL